MQRQEFDIDKAREQHAAYIAALRYLNVDVTLLPEEPDLPDSCFVEDPVIMLDELAILCRPGCASRLPEVDRIEPYIAAVRHIYKIAAPGTLEGGDVLRMSKILYVGLSQRTNAEGIRQLREIVLQFGYRVVAVNLHGCLHLKSAISSPSRDTVLVNPEWIDLLPFEDYAMLHVPDGEPWGANVLAVNGAVLAAQSAPRTADTLESHGLRVMRLDVSELQKAEAGLTCMSLLWMAN